MGVLLLSLSGPLQSWGDSSRFTVRQTRLEPTKSGVLGLVSAALGRMRGDSIDDLRGLEFGVRADQPGTVIRDFQTEKFKDGKNGTSLSHRYYLADAKFLAALGGSDELIGEIEAALRRPIWPLYLGRRSCPPDGPVCRRPVGGPYSDIRDALRSEPWIASDWFRKRLELQGDPFPDLEVTCDAREGEPFEVCMDLPLSFGEVRRYGRRHAARFFVANPDDSAAAATTTPLSVPNVLREHDPMSFL